MRKQSKGNSYFFHSHKYIGTGLVCSFCTKGVEWLHVGEIMAINPYVLLKLLYSFQLNLVVGSGVRFLVQIEIFPLPRVKIDCVAQPAFYLMYWDSFSG